MFGFLFAPIIIFFIIYLNICSKLDILVQVLIYKLKKQRKSIDDNDLLLECQKLKEIANKAQNLFSGHVFWAIFVSLLITIVLVYRSVSFLIGTDPGHLKVIVFFFGYIFYNSAFLFVIYCLNISSQKVKDDFQELASILKNDRILENRQKMVDGENISLKDLKDMVVSDLKEFDGFNGYDYFLLGKPLLTSIMANFTTYLIVLVQFKISEIGLESNDKSE